jgi:hypothetical protein
MPCHCHYDSHIECTTYSIRQFVTWGINYMGIMKNRKNKRASKTATKSVAKPVTKPSPNANVTTVPSTLVINRWIDANPTAPPIDPTASVGARNHGRYSNKRCTEWQRWVQTDCRDDQRTDDEIADIATVEFAVSSHVVSHNGRFPLLTVRAMRNEYNRGIRGKIVDGPVPQWHVKKSDGSRYGTLQLYVDDPKTGRRVLQPAVPYEPVKKP